MEFSIKKPRVILSSLIIATTLLSASNAFSLGKVSRSCAPATAQESISVDWGFVSHSLWTASSHYRNGAFLHTINTRVDGGNGWKDTWRSRAGHWGEPWYGRVIGYHYKRQGGIISFMGNSYATDCNLSQWGGS